MEALHGHLAPGEQTGAPHLPRPESPPRPRPHIADPRPTSPSSQQHQDTHETPQQQPKPPGRRQNAERKRLRQQRQSVDSDAPPTVKHGGGGENSTDRVPRSAEEEAASASAGPAQSKPETEPQEGGGNAKQKRERKPQRPGKYVCTYCGRACAKPSVLQKHIRSHTGERPYPCAPCGFSFKTKSNLYKHRKSHTHRVKAGLALGEPRSLDETVTESEDESKQLSSASGIAKEKQGGVACDGSRDADAPKPPSVVTDDSSYAVKKRLAMRLSRGKQGPLGSSDEKSSSLTLGSRGSTESGYFSRSESTEQSGDSPPSTTASAKSYAEIILGKYGRLGQLHARMARNQDQQNSSSSGLEDKVVPFTVPKKQVIDHITKLITINEAVVDTSKIDSVKPRRFSLTRKSSNESQKSSSAKEPPVVIHSPKPADAVYKNSGSITMGVPCEKFHHHHQLHRQSVNAEPPTGHSSTAPLLRSHSMPTAECTFDPSGGSPRRFRLSQSFDEQQSPAAARRYGMLRRQPAVEIPLEPQKEDYPGPLYRHDTAPPDHHTQIKPQPYECEACGTGCNDWDGYRAHKQRLCIAQHPLAASEFAVCQAEPRVPFASHPSRPAALAMRKRRKEESFEFDDPSVPVGSSSPASAVSSAAQCRDESVVVTESSKRPTVGQTFSVIQHTSSFEKQETLPCSEHQGTEPAKSSLCHEDQQALHHLKHTQQQPAKPPPRKLVRQHNVQVPEILVTEDSPNTTNATESTSEPPTSASKPPLEKPEEFQWPQRSPTLAQLPIEKLPPKKKRLRLVEAAQSSGDSSFDSASLPPRSPSQDSSASYASSRSASFEESGRADMAVATTAAMVTATATTPLRRSRAPHMLLTVPGLHPHREMRRSASEQAPYDPPHGGALTAEGRSKSFDYSCLSPERTAVGWRDRRKCLLMRHSAVRDPDEVEEETKRPVSPLPDHPADPTDHPADPPGAPSRASPAPRHCSRSASSPLRGDALPYNPDPSPPPPPRHEHFSQWKSGQNVLVGSAPVHERTVGPSKEEAHVPVLAGPVPGPYPPGPSGAARAHYLTVATGLKLSMSEYPVVGARAGPPSLPRITSSPEVLRPAPASPAVAVRLHADTHVPACAIYTTLSQPSPASPPGLQKPVCSSLTHHLTVPMDQGFQVWSEEGPRAQGSGGNKRMLSPSNSIELHPETQQQQKRVKEEDGPKEGEDEESVEAAAGAAADTSKKEEDPGSGRVRPPVTRVGPPLLSLQANTCHSWCYLNYVKPNPAALDQEEPSVYSSWSTTTGYDPNPPGLSSKTALSLLQCKQRRLSPAIYTMSPMSPTSPMSPMSTPSVTQPMEPEDNQRPSSAEVHHVRSCERGRAPTDESRRSARGHTPTDESRRSARGHTPTDESRRSARGHTPTDESRRSARGHTPTDESRRSARGHTPTDESRRSARGHTPTDESRRSARGHTPTDEGRRSAGQNRSNSHEEEEEEVQTSPKHQLPPQVSSCASRSSERDGCVRGALRGGKCECEEGFCLRKHTCLPAPHSTRCICKLCTSAVNAQGNLAKHVKWKAHETCHKDVSCSLGHSHEGVCEERAVCPDDLRDLRHPGPHDEEEENAQGDEDRERPTTSPPGRPTHPDGPSLQRGAPRCAVASAGALFRRCLDPLRAPASSPSTPSPLPCSRSPEDPTSPGAKPSPPRHLQSPGPYPPPDRLSPSSRRVSSSPVGRVSPVGRPVSPGRGVQSRGAPAATLAACPSRDARASEPGDGRADKARPQRAAASALSPRGGASPPRGLLSHLPLHSQNAARTRTSSLMIPLGGIHMIQPRSTAPLYALVTKRPPHATGTTPSPDAPVPPSSSSSTTTTTPPRPSRDGCEVEEVRGTEEAGSRNARPAGERRRRRRGGRGQQQQRPEPLKEPVAAAAAVERVEDGAVTHHHHKPCEGTATTATTATTAATDRSRRRKKKRKKNGPSPSVPAVPAVPAGGHEGRKGRLAPAQLRCQQQQDPLEEPPAEEEEDRSGAQSGGSRHHHRRHHRHHHRANRESAPEPSAAGAGEPREESKTTPPAGRPREDGKTTPPAGRYCSSSRPDTKAGTLCRTAAERAVQAQTAAAGHKQAPASASSPHSQR